MRAGFDDRTRSESWKSRTRTRITSDNLDSSQLKVIVVSLYAHPIIRWGDKFQVSILKQIERLEDYVRDHPKWIIASTAGEARAALKQGKRVFILSLETAKGTLDSEEDRRIFIDQKKIAIVTPFHLSPDRYGSPALYSHIAILNTPWEWFKSWTQDHKDKNGNYVNFGGVTDAGRDLVRDLVKRKVWIDLAHSTDRAQEDLQEILADQPPLYTHTMPRKYFPVERGVSEDQISRVKARKGIIGIVPSEDMHADILVEKPFSKTLCKSGIVIIAKIWKELAAQVGPERVMLGSDFNSPLSGISPECADSPEFKQVGFRDASQIPTFLDELKRLGAPVDSKSNLQIEAFLDAWSKVRP